jgi:hypothetical protein
MTIVDIKTLTDNSGTLITFLMTLSGTVIAVVKAWSLVNQRIKTLEDAQKVTLQTADLYRVRVEKFIDEQEENQEHVLESVYQLTTAVRGIDGYNGLTGRVRQIDERLANVEKLVAGNSARFEMWKEMNNERRQERNERSGDTK